MHWMVILRTCRTIIGQAQWSLVTWCLMTIRTRTHSQTLTITRMTSTEHTLSWLSNMIKRRKREMWMHSFLSLKKKSKLQWERKSCKRRASKTKWQKDSRSKKSSAWRSLNKCVCSSSLHLSQWMIKMSLHSNHRSTIMAQASEEQHKSSLRISSNTRQRSSNQWTSCRRW